MCLSRTAGGLLIRSREREICFFSHEQKWDTASSATVALNMINVSEHYIQCLKSFWLCLESARDHRDLRVFWKLMSVRQLHLSILLSVKHFCRLFVNKFSSAFTNKQKCNSTESFCTIFLANFEINFQKFTEKSRNSTTKVSVQLEKTKNPPKLHLSRAEINSKLLFRTVLRPHHPFLGSRPKCGQEGVEVMMTMRMVRLVLIKGKLWRLQLF